MYWLKFYKGQKKPPEVHMDAKTLANIIVMLKTDKTDRDFIEVVVH